MNTGKLWVNDRQSQGYLHPAAAAARSGRVVRRQKSAGNGLRRLSFWPLLGLLALMGSANASPNRLRTIDWQPGEDQVRLGLDRPVKPSQLQSEWIRGMVQITLQGVQIDPAQVLPSRGGRISKVFAYQYNPQVVRMRVNLSDEAGLPVDGEKPPVKLLMEGKTVKVVIFDAAAVAGAQQESQPFASPFEDLEESGRAQVSSFSGSAGEPASPGSSVKVEAGRGVDPEKKSLLSLEDSLSLVASGVASSTLGGPAGIAAEKEQESAEGSGMATGRLAGGASDGVRGLAEGKKVAEDKRAELSKSLPVVAPLESGKMGTKGAGSAAKLKGTKEQPQQVQQQARGVGVSVGVVAAAAAGSAEIKPLAAAAASGALSKEAKALDLSGTSSVTSSNDPQLGPEPSPAATARQARGTRPGQFPDLKQFLMKFLLVLASFLALAALVLRFRKPLLSWMAAKGAGAEEESPWAMKVVSRHQLDAKKSLALLKVGGEHFLLALTPESVSLLAGVKAKRARGADEFAGLERAGLDRDEQDFSTEAGGDLFGTLLESEKFLPSSAVGSRLGSVGVGGGGSLERGESQIRSRIKSRLEGLKPL